MLLNLNIRCDGENQRLLRLVLLCMHSFHLLRGGSHLRSCRPKLRVGVISPLLVEKVNKSILNNYI